MTADPIADKIARFQAIVSRSPDDELARFALAKACLDAGRVDEAKSHFAGAVALKDDWLMAWILLARCRMETGEPELARSALEKARALAIEQNHSDPLIEIDEMMEELGS